MAQHSHAARTMHGLHVAGRLFGRLCVSRLFLGKSSNAVCVCVCFPSHDVALLFDTSGKA